MISAAATAAAANDSAESATANGQTNNPFEHDNDLDDEKQAKWAQADVMSTKLTRK